ncbi:unnamed protein product, partial [Discosporangium mesarthrocarpum]
MHKKRGLTTSVRDSNGGACPLRCSDGPSSCPLTMDQLSSLLDGSMQGSIGALFCRAEAVLAKLTAATSVDLFLVDHWHKKLFSFFATSSASPGGGSGGPGVGGAAHCVGAEAESEIEPEHEHEMTSYDTRSAKFVAGGPPCEAARLGEELEVPVYPEKSSLGREKSLGHEQGTVYCWPVLDPTMSQHAGSQVQEALMELPCGNTAKAETNTPATVSLVDIAPRGDVLAVVQVYLEDGGLSEAMRVAVRKTCLLLGSLVKGSLTRCLEDVRCRTAEVLLSLTEVSSRERGLMEVVQDVVNAAEQITGAERVCLFFVDDQANELWVARSIEFDDAKVKIGHGICGTAAATGEVMNVVNSYENPHFDPSFDKQTGFRTKSVLCVPIPPPEHGTHGPTPTNAVGGAVGGVRPGENPDRIVGNHALGVGHSRHSTWPLGSTSAQAVDNVTGAGAWTRDGTEVGVGIDP